MGLSSSACRLWALVWLLLSANATSEEFPMEQKDDVHPTSSTGIMFFGYGADDTTAMYYLQQAVVSARRIKKLNPGTNMTIVTNPTFRPPEVDRVFDMIINIEERYIYEGKTRAATSPIHRQWLTRLEYLTRSPYEVTLALDSQALCCATTVDNVLNQLRWTEFDIAFAVQGPRLLAPHNWAIAYRLNFNTRRLFTRWRNLQVDYGRAGTDQLTLHMAAGSLALQGKLNVGVLSENVALATVIYDREGPEYPKSSTLVDPRPVHFVHYDAQSPEDEETTCAKLNVGSNRARVVFLPRPFPRWEGTHRRRENIYEVVYSERELADAAHEARENAPFFRHLDWENEKSKWGRVATPWQDHYKNCLHELAKEVNAGIRHIYRNPANLWDNNHFAKEFANDSLVWPAEGRGVRVLAGTSPHRHQKRKTSSAAKPSGKL